MARRLGETCHVLEPFQRGSGRDTLSVAPHVADLRDVVTSRCHSGPVALVGHSWGAMLALAYAAQQADHVASIVLVSSGTFTVEACERMHAILDARTDASLRQRLRVLDEECADSDERLAEGEALMTILFTDADRAELASQEITALKPMR